MLHNTYIASMTHNQLLLNKEIMATIRYNKKEYLVLSDKCRKRECFVPFSGNGTNICRLYELGQCPEKYLSPKNKKH